MRRRGSRGMAALLALMVVAAFGTIIAVGLAQRANDLSFEPRSLCRAAARQAAESGIARLRARPGRPGVLEGRLEGGPSGARVSYTTSASGGRVVSTGRCALPEGRASDVRIAALLSQGAVVAWREGPT